MVLVAALQLAAWLRVAPRQRAPAAAGEVAPKPSAGPAPQLAGLPSLLSSGVAGTRALPVVWTEPVGSGSLARHPHAGYRSRTPTELSGLAALLSFP